MPVSDRILKSVAALPFSAGERLEIIEILVFRAAEMQMRVCDFCLILEDKMLNALKVPNSLVADIDLVSILLELCRFRAPINFVVPAYVGPPPLFLRALLWRVLCVFVVIATWNSMFAPFFILYWFSVSITRSRFGGFVWENLRVARTLIEMLILHRYSFPTITFFARADLMSEPQYEQFEKDVIQSLGVIAPDVGFSRELMLLDANSPARTPPATVLRALEMLNDRFRLGYHLCTTRQPNYLLDMSKQCDSRSLVSFLGPIIEQDPTILSALPPRSLCDALVAQVRSNRQRFLAAVWGYRQRGSALSPLAEHLLRTLSGYVYGFEERVATDVVVYLLQCWSTSSSDERYMYMVSLSVIILFEAELPSVDPNLFPPGELAPMDSEQSTWWLCTGLSSIPLFPQLASKLSSSLHAVLKSEVTVHLFWSILCALSLCDASKSMPEVLVLLFLLVDLLIRCDSIY